jgi:hypothetical protein
VAKYKLLIFRPIFHIYVMKVILKQSGLHQIDLCIETSDTCITIYTSVAYAPYDRLYIWLGKIRDRQ